MGLALAYLIAYAVVVLTQGISVWGALHERFGRRRVPSR
jgi:hypothetical protein